MQVFITQSSNNKAMLYDAIARLRNINDKLVGPRPEEGRGSLTASERPPLMRQLEGEISDTSHVIQMLHQEISRLHEALELGDDPVPTAAKGRM